MNNDNRKEGRCVDVGGWRGAQAESVFNKAGSYGRCVWSELLSNIKTLIELFSDDIAFAFTFSSCYQLELAKSKGARSPMSNSIELL